MLKLNLGFNYTQAHFDVLMKLLDQEHDDIEISSIYGSPGVQNPLGSVRESHRESTPTHADLIEWMLAIKSRGVEINLTINSMRMPREALFVRYLEDIASVVDNFIIAHPGIIDMAHKHVPRAKIIVSTIMNVHTLPQVQWIKNNWPQVVRICPALEKNRDFDWLRKANAIIPLELLANEFCSMGGVTCEGLYRQACYLGQSMGETWCARDKCMEQRKADPSAWLRSYFILPQWMRTYEQETGVEHFKITGRTHGPEYLKFIAETYLSQKATGNLLTLWGQLEATMPDADQTEEQKKALETTNIPIELLDRFYPGSCTPDRCGIKCMWCEAIMENLYGKR